MNRNSKQLLVSKRSTGWCEVENNVVERALEFNYQIIEIITYACVKGSRCLAFIYAKN